MPSIGTSEEFVDEAEPAFDEAQATLAEFSPGSQAGSLSLPKKLLLVACVFAIGGLVYFLVAGLRGNGSTSSAPEEGEIRVPDHEAAATLTAEENQERAKNKSREDVESAAEQVDGDAAIAVADPAPPVEPAGAASSAGAQEEPAAKRLARAREDLHIRAMLEMEEQSLALRRAALVSASPIRGFGEAQRRATVGGGRGRSAELEMGEQGGDPDNVIAQLAAPMRALIEARKEQEGGGAIFGDEPTADIRRIKSREDNQDDPHRSRDKLDFFQAGGEQLRTSGEVGIAKQRNPYELHMGDVIPGVMISGINSESPGEIIGQVSVDVYDSTNGNHLLIPQGSRLVGTYNATVSKGQTRVQIAWTRLRLRNGDQVDLGGMSGADQIGVSGFQDRVNRHIGRRIGAALLTTAFTVAYEMTAPRGGNLHGSAVHRGVGESIVQTANDMAREEAKLPPTLEIRPGYRFNIMVNRDIKFAGPYRGDGLDPAVLKVP